MKKRKNENNTTSPKIPRIEIDSQPAEENIPMLPEHIPNEIFTHIFSFLDLKSLGRAATANIRFYNIISETEEVWKPHFYKLSKFYADKFKALPKKNIHSLGQIQKEYITMIWSNCVEILKWLLNSNTVNQNANQSASDDEDENNVVQNFRSDWKDFYDQNLVGKEEIFVVFAKFLAKYLSNKELFPAGINVKGRAGCTIAHIFALMGKAAALQVLFENGADITIKNEREEDVAAIAIRGDNLNFEVLQWLFERGASYDLKILNHNFLQSNIEESEFVKIIAFLCYTFDGVNNVQPIYDAAFKGVDPEEVINIKAMINEAVSHFRNATQSLSLKFT